MIAQISLRGDELWSVAGWTMLHFLWLGTIVGLAAMVCRLLLRRASSGTRYVLALASLAILAALPVAIGAWLIARSPTVTADTIPVAELETVELNEDSELRVPSAAPGFAGGREAGDHMLAVDGSVAGESTYPRQSRGLTVLSEILDACVPHLPWLWVIGTPLTFVLLATGIVGAERLRRGSRAIVDGPIAETCVRLRQSLGITRQVAVAVCERIAAPVLVGILRPVILLPPAALTGWSPDEIEMVLLHELAHVRRWDNLVNLVERLIESLLFFHPAVWLVSGWARREREACCDAIVVGRTRRPHAYAEMLVALAAQMPRSVLFHPAASSAMAAGPLRSRILRILQSEDDPMLVSGKSFVVVVAGLLVASALAVLYLPSASRAEESAAEATESTEPSRTTVEVDLTSDAKRSTTAELPYSVSFEEGASRFLDGDHIQVLEVQGTARTFEPGNVYWIKGTYTLGSHDRAQLSAFTTARDAANGRGPIWEIQTTKINRGNGTFELFLPMSVSGWPHVSFYPADGGDGFGGVYVGTGDTVLKEWWAENDSTSHAAEVAGEKTGTAILKAREFATSVTESTDAALNFQEPGSAADQLSTNQLELDSRDSLAVIEADKGQVTIQSTPKDDWAAGVVFASSKDREISRRAWTELGIKVVPASEAELQLVRTFRWRGGLKLVDFDDRIPHAEGPFILTEISSKALSTGITNFGHLEKVLDAIDSLPADAIVILNGAHKRGRFNYSMRRPEASMRPKTSTSAQFPSLEDQKLADQAWKALHLELSPISDDDLKRVQAMGYAGGVKVDATSAPGPILTGDVLVGLHVWPTRSLQDVIEVLNRDDLAELNPLKFYVVRPKAVGPFGGQEERDSVVTGRITANLPKGRFSLPPSARSLGGAGRYPQPIELEFEQVLAGDPQLSDLQQELMMAEYQRTQLSKNSKRPTRSSAELDREIARLRAQIDRYRAQVREQIRVQQSDSRTSPSNVDRPHADTLELRTEPTSETPEANAWEPKPKRVEFDNAAGSPTTARNKASLRYDGRTFDEWRQDFLNRGPREENAFDALQAFANAGYGREATKAILSGVFSRNVRVQRSTRKYLSKLSPEEAGRANGDLIQVLQSELSAHRRIDAIRAIAAMGPNASSALEPLKRRLASTNHQERISAAAAIKMIVGKDRYQKPIADVLGDELGITVVESNGAWGALPKEGVKDGGQAFNEFTAAVIKEQQELFPSVRVMSRGYGGRGGVRGGYGYGRAGYGEAGYGRGTNYGDEQQHVESETVVEERTTRDRQEQNAEDSPELDSPEGVRK